MSDLLDSRTGLQANTKQPAESRLYTFDFTALLGTETVSGVTSIVQANQGLVTSSTNLTLGTPSFSSPLAQIRLSAGQANEDYKLTALITDSGGNTLELDGILKVRDL